MSSVAVAVLAMMSLINAVNEAPYNVSDYELGVFDCTNEGALLHDWLEERGYDVKVVVGRNGNTYTSGHLWLIVGNVDYIVKSHSETRVVLEEGSYWVEPMFKLVMEDLPEWYHFRDIRVFEEPKDVYFWPQNEFEY